MKVIGFILSLAASSAALIAVVGIGTSKPEDNLILFGSACIDYLGSWCHFIDPLTNAFGIWRLSPLASLLADSLSTLAGASLSLNSLDCSILLLFVCLTALFSSILPKWPLMLAPALSAMVVISIFVISGRQQIVFDALSFCGLFLHALKLASSGQVPNRYLAYIGLTGFLVAFSANQLSALILLLSIFIFPIKLSEQTGRTILLIVLVISAFSLFAAPAPILPAYPPGTQVVPEDGLPGVIIPYFAPAASIQFIDRTSLKGAFAWPAILALTSCIFMFAMRRSNLSTRGLLFAGAVVLAGAADVLFKEEFAQLGPLAALARIVPHFWFFNLVQIALPLGIIFIAVLLAAHGHVMRTVLMCLLLIFAVVDRPRSGFKNPFETTSSRATEGAVGAQAPERRENGAFWGPHSSLERFKNGQEPIFETSTRVKSSLAKEFSDLPPPQAHAVESFVVSPSFRVIETMGLEILGRKEHYFRTDFKTLKRESASVTVSHKPELAMNIFGRNNTDRWTPGKSRQEGDEWLVIRLNEAVDLDGLELSTRNFVTDFPRGLRISATVSCAEGISKDALTGLAEVFAISPWRGAVQITESGHPYFRGEYDVRVIFPRTIRAQCLLVEQIGQEPRFDWSVSRIKMLAGHLVD